MYTASTRGRSPDDEGFVHCSYADQVDATIERFYSDLDQVVILRIDADALADDVVVAVEDLLGAGEHFPHVYGPIPVAAVASSEVHSRAAMQADDCR